MSYHEPCFSRKTDVSAVTLGGSAPFGAQVYAKGVKRGLDLLLVLMSAPFTLPLIALLALAVWIGGGSPFYRQDRIGQNGRIFRLWKLRTMVRDADARLEAYLAADPAARLEWDITQKLKADPRVTRLGHILRKTSLDELPQLWNVLRGDMSLVGPRPMMPDQRALYPGQAYFALRPGITGSWQVSERNRSTFAERATFDTDYANNLSFARDITILFATVQVVLNQTGC